MDGIHDLGGKQGFGPVEREQNEPAFHERWETRVFSFMEATYASGACRNVDQFRHAIERIDPRAYLTHGYYGRWLGGSENLLVEAGVLDRDEIDARTRERGARPMRSSRRARRRRPTASPKAPRRREVIASSNDRPAERRTSGRPCVGRPPVQGRATPGQQKIQEPGPPFRPQPRWTHAPA